MPEVRGSVVAFVHSWSCHKTASSNASVGSVKSWKSENNGIPLGRQMQELRSGNHVSDRGRDPSSGTAAIKASNEESLRSDEVSALQDHSRLRGTISNSVRREHAIPRGTIHHIQTASEELSTFRAKVLTLL